MNPSYMLAYGADKGSVEVGDGGWDGARLVI